MCVRLEFPTVRAGLSGMTKTGILMCRQAAELSRDVETRRAEELHRRLSVQAERSQRLHQTLIAPMVKKNMEQRAFDVYTWAYERLPDNLPARCGHHAFPCVVNGLFYVLVLAGRNCEGWQPSALAMSLPNDRHASSKPEILRLHVSQVASDCTSAMELVESAACRAGQNTVLVCGGRERHCECNQIWIGELTHDANQGQGGTALLKANIGDMSWS